MTSTRSLVDSSDLFKSLEAGDFLGDLKYLSQLENVQTADLDLPNILAAYLIPLPLDLWRNKYTKAQQNVEKSQAWEAATTENLVLKNIKSEKLPSDNSYESKLERTRYRLKVIQVLRDDHSIWLGSISSDTGHNNSEVHKSEARTKVLSTLSSLLPHSFAELDILLRPISRGILEGRAADQHYLFTFVTHAYDQVQDTVFTTLHDLSVSIKIEDVSTKDRVKIAIVWINKGWSFIHHQWDEEEEKIGDSIIKAGEKILEKKSLHLT